MKKSLGLGLILGLTVAFGFSFHPELNSIAVNIAVGLTCLIIGYLQGKNGK